MNAVLDNCIVFYNTAPPGLYKNYYNATFRYCCTTPAAPGDGNITNAPLFVDTNAANYRLQPGSACINAGNNAYVQGTLDLDGNPRMIGGWVDMGAYEFVGGGSVDSDNDGLTDGQEWQLGTDPRRGDTDGDGMMDGDEVSAGTDPTKAASVLAITGLQVDGNAFRISWSGGTSVWQYLQRRYDLISTDEEWTTVFTNSPPMPVNTNIVDSAATNPTIFYRIKVAR